MSRPLRIEYESAVYHVTSRGNERRRIFLDDKDYQKFLHILEIAVERHGILMYAYILMPNHYHLLFETPGANLTTFMHNVQSSYATYFNIRRKRAGHLFQGRYKAILIEKESHLMELHRYIHLNPVRARLEEHPREWKWSSYSEFTNPQKQKSWLRHEELLDSFGTNRTRAIKLYREFIECDLREPAVNPMVNVVAQSILGGEKFIKMIRSLVRRKHTEPPKRVPDFSKLTRWDTKEAQEALAKIASFYRVETEKLISKNRINRWQRDVSMFVFFKCSRWSLVEIGELFSVSNSAVSKAIARVNEAIKKNKKLGKEVNHLYSTFSA